MSDKVEWMRIIAQVKMGDVIYLYHPDDHARLVDLLGEHFGCPVEVNEEATVISYQGIELYQSEFAESGKLTPMPRPQPFRYLNNLYPFREIAASQKQGGKDE